MYLPLLSERHDAVALGDFGEWMLENIDACFKVAEHLGYGVERMDDIVLVTGCHLAKSWVSAIFSESSGGSEVSFGVRVSRISSVRFDERNVTGRGLKLGPSGEVGLCTTLGLQPMLTDYAPDILRAESSPEPMHFCSRISRLPQFNQVAQVQQDPLPDSVNVNLNQTGVLNSQALRNEGGSKP